MSVRSRDTHFHGGRYLAGTRSSQRAARSPISIRWSRPQVTPLGSFAALTVHFAARSPTQTPAFRLETVLEAVEAQTMKVTKFTTTAPGKDSFPGRSAGHETTSVFAEKLVLKGTGKARLFLLGAERAAGTNALSNVLEVEIAFPGTEAKRGD